jgi:death-on-curing protein
VKYLTVEQVLFIHSRIVAETGGSNSVRDLGMLESAVARPRAAFEGKEMYAGVFNKAAALMGSLINNHPFADGNKRTGITAAALFLLRNGWQIDSSPAALEKITLRVAINKIRVVDLAKWLRANSKSVVRRHSTRGS